MQVPVLGGLPNTLETKPFKMTREIEMDHQGLLGIDRPFVLYVHCAVPFNNRGSFSPLHIPVN